MDILEAGRYLLAHCSVIFISNMMKHELSFMTLFKQSSITAHLLQGQVSMSTHTDDGYISHVITARFNCAGVTVEDIQASYSYSELSL